LVSIPGDISEAYGEFYDAWREVFFGDGPLKIYEGTGAPYTLLDTYTTGWRLVAKHDPKAGKEVLKLELADLDGTRRAKMRKATVVEAEGVYYKRGASDPPFGDNKIWRYAVQPTGEQV
jgi:hypothetical protein